MTHATLISDSDIRQWETVLERASSVGLWCFPPPRKWSSKRFETLIKAECLGQENSVTTAMVIASRCRFDDCSDFAIALRRDSAILKSFLYSHRLRNAISTAATARDARRFRLGGGCCATSIHPRLLLEYLITGVDEYRSFEVSRRTANCKPCGQL